jgi:hypothetical protein
MTYTMPLRRTIRHLAQRFRIDGETFITTLLAIFHSQCSQVFDYTRSSTIRLDYTQSQAPSGHGSRDSQDKRFSFGDSHRMLKMGGQ